MAHPGHDSNSRYRHAQGGSTGQTGRFLDFYERKNILPAQDDEPWVIETKYENRPDAIANKFYSNSKLGWVILIRNNIDNPLTDLVAGTTLYIPSNNRVQSEILS